MCGIVGYLGGHRPIIPVLVGGLERVEYRGYDSAGVAVLDPNLRVVKAVGKVKALTAALDGQSFRGNVGIAHTRWATHGEPSPMNAHPLTDCQGRIAIVHNGIIENYVRLHRILTQRHTIVSETDTELLAHLIEEEYHGDLTAAVRAALRHVQGTYGIAVIHQDHPRTIVAARLSSPLLVGRGVGEYFVASDVASILEYTRDVYYLDDGEMVTLTDAGPVFVQIENGDALEKASTYVDWDLERAEKEGFDTFMEKEIFQQPVTLADAFRGRLIPITAHAHLGGPDLQHEELRKIKRLHLLGCGTSWHAGLVGEIMIEELADLPVTVSYASEFRYTKMLIEDGTAVFAISQSGESIDTLEAFKAVQRRLPSYTRPDDPREFVDAFGIVNVIGSSIARAAGRGILLHAGPEKGVASTKAFTSQVAVLALLGLWFGRARGSLSEEAAREFIAALQALPDQVKIILAANEEIKQIALAFVDRTKVFFLGRWMSYPVVLEGALKYKEISYVHAEGFAGAEMKHGPIALIDEEMLVVAVVPQDHVHDKMLNNLKEVKARMKQAESRGGHPGRQGRIIAVATRGDDDIRSVADHVIEIPATHRLLTPILSVVPLQLLAYHVAIARGCDVDNPRNLAKSVTVE